MLSYDIARRIFVRVEIRVGQQRHDLFHAGGFALYDLVELLHSLTLILQCGISTIASLCLGALLLLGFRSRTARCRHGLL